MVPATFLNCSIRQISACLHPKTLILHEKGAKGVFAAGLIPRSD
jgi:hypothetical protein